MLVELLNIHLFLFFFSFFVYLAEIIIVSAAIKAGTSQDGS